MGTYQNRLMATENDIPSSRCVTGKASLAYKKATGPVSLVSPGRRLSLGPHLLRAPRMQRRPSDSPCAGEYDATNKNMKVAMTPKLARDSGIM